MVVKPAYHQGVKPKNKVSYAGISFTVHKGFLNKIRIKNNSADLKNTDILN